MEAQSDIADHEYQTFNAHLWLLSTIQAMQNETLYASWLLEQGGCGGWGLCKRAWCQNGWKMTAHKQQPYSILIMGSIIRENRVCLLEIGPFYIVLSTKKGDAKCMVVCFLTAWDEGGFQSMVSEWMKNYFTPTNLVRGGRHEHSEMSFFLFPPFLLFPL
jgi:hypothetical protein